MLRLTHVLASILTLAGLAHATGGGFAAGDLWMNAFAMPGTSFGGLVRLDPFTLQPTLVLPWTSSNVLNEGAQAFCYDPGRDRILVFGFLDGEAIPALWQVDAAGNHSHVDTIYAFVAMTPATDGKVYVTLPNSTANPLGVLGWLDSAGTYTPLKDAGGVFTCNPFGITTAIAGGVSLAYDASQHALLLAMPSFGTICKGGFASEGKSAIYKLNLSPDGTRVLSQTCETYDIDGPNGGGGVPQGLSHGPNGQWLLVARGPGPVNMPDAAAPRMQQVSPTLVVTPFATNGPYTQAAWTTAGVYSNVRHQAVIFDAFANRLRAYDMGEIGAGGSYAINLVGGSFGMERAALLEIGPIADAEGSLVGTPSQISLATGGSQTLAIDFGPGLAGKIYLVLGSASGFTPGFTLKGHTLPLEYDAYTQLMLQMPNGFLVTNSYGVLDIDGKAQAQFNLPAGAPAALAGLILHHAAVAAQGGSTILGVTNAAPVKLLP